MNIRTIFAVAMTMAACAVGAQERDPSQRNHFYIGGRLHFNVSAEMRNLPIAAESGPTYDDGFVGDDSSANAGGRTWNWGYSKTNQIFEVGDHHELEVHGAASVRDGTSDHMTGDLQYGFEMGYGRELKRWGDENRPIRLGAEISFAASALALDVNDTVNGTTPRLARRFAFAPGVVPPNGPYAGSFQGPLPPGPPASLILTNIVSDNTTMETETSRQSADIEGTYWGFRLGPFIEAPLPGRFSVQGGAGLAVVYVNAKLSYEEKFTITGLGGAPQDRIDSQISNDILVGFYINGRLNYWLSDVVALYVGGEFQMLQDFTLTAANREAKVDFGSGFGVTLGVLYSF